jgi:oligosaccharide reducing-end xylanase
MKKYCIVIVMLAFNVLCFNTFSQTKSGPYEVATWQGFRDAAVSYTFDDNCPNQLAVAIPMMNSYGFKATMFVPSAWIKDWTGLQNAADRGNEIASHTVTHANLGNLTPVQQIPEFKDSREAINAHIIGHSCITIAYPFCERGNDSLCMNYYMAARACQDTIESKTPADFMNISSIPTGTESSIQTVPDFNNKVEKADSIKGWCVFLIHGIDNDGGYSPTQSEVMRSHFEFMKLHNNRFWIAPFGDVVRYIRERNTAIVKEILNRKTSITLRVSDKPENPVYNCPLTIRRVLPKKWKSATIEQNGQKIKTEIVSKDGLKYIMFDIVPGNRDILILRQ